MAGTAWREDVSEDMAHWPGESEWENPLTACPLSCDLKEKGGTALRYSHASEFALHRGCWLHTKESTKAAVLTKFSTLWPMMTVKMLCMSGLTLCCCSRSVNELLRHYDNIGNISHFFSGIKEHKMFLSRTFKERVRPLHRQRAGITVVNQCLKLGAC